MENKKDDVVNEIVKKPKGKPRGGNNILTEAGLNLDKGDNAKYMAVSLKLFQMPKIDLHKPEEVRERLTEYYRIYGEADMKPTIVGLAMALGTDRRRLWEIKVGDPKAYDLPTEVSDMIKKAYDINENLWETYMLHNKINTVSGIFLGKNHFGYQDKQEHVITPNTHNDSDYNADDIKKRYLIDSTTLEQLSDGSDS